MELCAGKWGGPRHALLSLYLRLGVKGQSAGDYLDALQTLTDRLHILESRLGRSISTPSIPLPASISAAVGATISRISLDSPHLPVVVLGIAPTKLDAETDQLDTTLVVPEQPSTP